MGCLHLVETGADNQHSTRGICLLGLAMADGSQTVIELSQMLNNSLLDRVRRFWFRHITDDHHLIVPDKEEALIWFSQNDEFDQECM